MIKICRLGHRTPNKGVVTIASKVDIDAKKVWYGVSYCSPQEKQYYKKLGNELALENLEEYIDEGRSIFFQNEFVHGKILKAILEDLYWNYPRSSWSQELIFKQLCYPVGLKRYPKLKNHPIDHCDIKEIVVETEYAKEQLILAFRYLHSLREIDTDFVAINNLVHMNHVPDKIVVRL